MEYPKVKLEKLTLFLISLGAILFPFVPRLQVCLGKWMMGTMPLGMWLYWVVCIAMVLFGALGLITLLKSMSE